MVRSFSVLLLASTLGCAAGANDAGESAPFGDSAKPGGATSAPGSSGGESEGESGSGGGATGAPTSGEATSAGTGGSTSTGGGPGGSSEPPPPGGCGDGVVDPGEECDDGNLIDTDTCTSTCEPATCGDGFVQPGEGCDDGNLDANDACEPDCQLPGCGDGVVQGGEECDDGNMTETDGCTSLCKKPVCGDGFQQAGEQCDDGNGITTDACVNCKPAVCGDGAVFQGGEDCDDSNDVVTDACVNCKAAKCGDGVVWSGNEQCDGGGVANGSCAACKLSCNAGYGDCDKGAGNGCEAKLASDPNNCGGCGKSCGGEACVNGACVVEHGPQHTFVGLTSSLFVTQGCCSVNCAGNNAVDAAYFCAHFYGANCTPLPGYSLVLEPANTIKMHKYGGCTNVGTPIPNTQCDGGQCRMYTVPEQASGLTNLICQCK